MRKKTCGYLARAYEHNTPIRKIKGEDIHIYGRLVGLVDVFDAIFSNRVYRKAMPLEKALNIMREEAGKHFDPRLAGLFLDNLPKFLAIAERYGADGLAVPPEVVEIQS